MSTRTVASLAVSLLAACVLSALAVAHVQEKAHMETYVLMFRSHSKESPDVIRAKVGPLIPAWAEAEESKGMKFEPRILGESLADLAPLDQEDATTKSADSPITALLFVEAPNKEAAIEAAEAHPGRKFGFEIDVHQWSTPPPAKK